MRIPQWTKNFFIFAALIFSQNFFNLSYLLRCVGAFFIFSLLTGSVYIINDIVDRESDKLHPLKSKRPITSGNLDITAAKFTAILLCAISLITSFFLSRGFFYVCIVYFLLMLSYSFILKKVVILDVLTISIAFVLRAVAGAVVIQVKISVWLFICTILLALFLALNKRRYELVTLETNAQHHRKSLLEYSPYLLDQMISVVTAATLVAYCIYTVAPETVRKFHTEGLVLTIPFVIYGIFRYLYLVHKKESGGSPERTLLEDKPLVVGIILWIVAVGIIIYL